MSDKAELRALIADYKPYFGSGWRYSNRRCAFFRRDGRWVQVVGLFVSQWGGAYVPTNVLDFLVGIDLGRTCYLKRLEDKRTGLDRWIRKRQHVHRLDEIVREMVQQFRPPIDAPFDQVDARRVVVHEPRDWATLFMESVLAVERMDFVAGQKYRDECLHWFGSRESSCRVEAIATLDRYLEMMDRPEELRATLAEVEERNWAAFLKWAGLKK